MPTLLQLDSSPLESSISRELTREFAKTWQNAHPDGRVVYRDLAANPPKPLDTPGYTPPSHMRKRVRLNRRRFWLCPMSLSPSWTMQTST
jgi:FMN-dependent NADH-azoreductase